MYDEAVKLCPENPAYLGNRSAAYMMLGMYKKALEDAQKAVALDPTFTKGYIRIAKCCVALGKTIVMSISHFSLYNTLAQQIYMYGMQSRNS